VTLGSEPNLVEPFSSTLGKVDADKMLVYRTAKREGECAMSVLRFIDGKTFRNIGLHCLWKSRNVNLSLCFN